MSKKVIITGGSGYIGGLLGNALTQKGYEVVSLDINSPSSPRMKFVEADLSMGIPEHVFLEKPTYVINLAGAPIFGRWTTEYREQIYHSRIDGTNNLIQFMTNPLYRPVALISASATGFYGDSGTENVDEKTEVGNGFLAQVALDWENAARSAERLGVRTTVIRNGHVLGQGGFIKELQKFTRFKILPQLSDGTNCLPWIHQDDLVNIYIQSMEEPHAPDVINAVAPEIATSGEFYRELASQTNSRLIKVPSAISQFVLKDLIKEFNFGQCVKSNAISSRYNFKYRKISSAIRTVITSR